jgi:beta-lactamase class A
MLGKQREVTSGAKTVRCNLNDFKTLVDDKVKRGDQRRAGERARRGRTLSLLSFLSIFVVVGLTLFFGGWLGKERVPGTTPVQSAIQSWPSSPAPSPEKTAPGFDEEALQYRIEEIIEGYTGTYGVAVLEPDSGTRVSLRGDEEFSVASIGKLPPFAALYRAAAREELDLEEEISIRSSDVQGYGSGVLHSYPVGHSLSLRDTAHYLVNSSDNTAWMMLNRRLGEEKIEAELEEMGAKNSKYSDYYGYDTTPDDVLLLLEKLSDPQFTSKKLSTEMLEAMTETVFEDRIPEKLPLEAVVAHKTGSYGDNFGDAGVVFYKDRSDAEKRYYLVVLAKGVGEYEARDVMQDISVAVYEALAATKVDPTWSRGEFVRREQPAPRESEVDNSAAGRPAWTESTEKPKAAEPPPDEKSKAAEPPPDEKSKAAEPPPDEKPVPDSSRDGIPPPRSEPATSPPEPVTSAPADSGAYYERYPEDTGQEDAAGYYDDGSYYDDGGYYDDGSYYYE